MKNIKNIKKQIFGLLLFVVFCVNVGYVSARGPVSPTISPSVGFCSTTLRGSGNPETFFAMYSFGSVPVMGDYYKALGVNMSQIVDGAELRYHNSNNNSMCKKGNSTASELAVRNAFWGKYSDEYSTLGLGSNPNASAISASIIGKMQAYILRACGLNVAKDGKLGKRTVNSTLVCSTLPCEGKCGYEFFSTYSQGGQIKRISDKTPIYDAGSFSETNDNNMYLDPSTITNWKGDPNDWDVTTKKIIIDATTFKKKYGISLYEEEKNKCNKNLTQKQYDFLSGGGYGFSDSDNSCCFDTQANLDKAKSPTNTIIPITDLFWTQSPLLCIPDNKRCKDGPSFLFSEAQYTVLSSQGMKEKADKLCCLPAVLPPLSLDSFWKKPEVSVLKINATIQGKMTQFCEKRVCEDTSVSVLVNALSPTDYALFAAGAQVNDTACCYKGSISGPPTQGRENSTKTPSLSNFSFTPTLSLPSPFVLAKPIILPLCQSFCGGKITNTQLNVINELPILKGKSSVNIKDVCCITRVAGLSGDAIKKYEIDVLAEIGKAGIKDFTIAYCADSACSTQQAKKTFEEKAKVGLYESKGIDGKGMSPIVANTYIKNIKDLSDKKEDKNLGCGCKQGSKQIRKTFFDRDGNPLPLQVCESCDPIKCNCGIKLNTSVPFIGRCIMYGDTNSTTDSGYVGEGGDAIVVNSLNAFPVLMGAIVQFLMIAIVVICLGSLIVAGVMMTIEGYYDTGKSLIKKVVITIILLGSSGTILYLINPNFFY